MNTKLLFIIPTISLFTYCSSNKTESKEIHSTENEETKNIDDNGPKTFSSNVFSLEKDKMELKNLLKEHHENYKNEINLELLNQKLNSSDPHERRSAVKLLSYFPEYGTLVTKVEELLLNDNNTEVRSECAITLQLLESKRSIPALIKALEDKDIEVKTNSMESLAALGEKEHSFIVADELWDHGKEGAPFRACQFAFRDIATPKAIKRLEYDMNNNTDKNVAISAAIILAQLGFSDKTLPFFKESLNYEDKYIRIAALRGLSYIGNEKALQLIYSKSDDPDELVKERALALKEKFDQN